MNLKLTKRQEREMILDILAVDDPRDKMSVYRDYGQTDRADELQHVLLEEHYQNTLKASSIATGGSASNLPATKITASSITATSVHEALKKNIMRWKGFV